MNDFNLNMVTKVLDINNDFIFHNDVLIVFKILYYCLVTFKIKDTIIKVELLMTYMT